MRNFPWRYVALYIAAAFLYSFTSWQANDSPSVWVPPYLAPQFWLLILIHETAHFLAGGIASLPTKSWVLFLAAGMMGLLIDVDHIGWFVGLPMFGRVAHSFVFMLLIFGLVLALGRVLRPAGLRTSSLVLAGIAAASVPAHLAVEALTPYRDVYPWAPFSFQPWFLQPYYSVGLLALSLFIVWKTVVGSRLFGRRQQA